MSAPGYALVVDGREVFTADNLHDCWVEVRRLGLVYEIGRYAIGERRPVVSIVAIEESADAER